mmetsp:Transcript_16559/g.47121  ORF Transcript_16559/g.47121 Transcript_16559/m.47121 type:complete len:219 (+) Transcript_16559:609-1265(+)
MAEEPVRSAFEVAVALLQSQLRRVLLKTHAAQHRYRLWVSSTSPSSTSPTGSGARGRGLCKVRVFHVLEHPLHGLLGASVLDRDQGLLAPVLVKAHRDQLHQELGVRLDALARASPACGCGRLVAFRKLRLTRLQTCPPELAQIEGPRHRHAALELLRHPVVPDDVPLELNNQVPREGGHLGGDHRLATPLGRGRVKVVHLLGRPERGSQAGVERDHR